MDRLEIGGDEVFIDSEDRRLIEGFAWRIIAPDRRYPDKKYVMAWRGRMCMYMHRLIAGAGTDDEVDHTNLNGLDNRKENLRIATRSQNHANRRKLGKKGTATSQYKGVHWDKARQCWAAALTFQGRTVNLGRHANEADAARAYDTKARELWGEFARLNFEEGVGV